MLRTTMRILVITIISSLIITGLYSFTFWNWINTLFLCSLFLTITGAVMHIIQVGFFNGIIKSFHYFFKKVNKREEVVNQVENRDPNLTIPSITLPIRIPLFISGGSLLVVSTVVSLFL